MTWLPIWLKWVSINIVDHTQCNTCLVKVIDAVYMMCKFLPPHGCCWHHWCQWASHIIQCPKAMSCSGIVWQLQFLWRKRIMEKVNTPVMFQSRLLTNCNQLPTCAPCSECDIIADCVSIDILTGIWVVDHAFFNPMIPMKSDLNSDWQSLRWYCPVGQSFVQFHRTGKTLYHVWI